MSIYAIGDIQGCATALNRLLEKIRFDPASDQLWLTGDLVNRGPESLETLRLVRNLGDSAITVLGNHDLHLLAVAAGVKALDSQPTLTQVSDADDRDELLHWLKRLPLAHYDKDVGVLMVHAGLAPQWSLEAALGYAGEVERALTGPDDLDLLHHMYGNQPNRWNANLRGHDRLRFIINCFTRLRYCDRKGRLNLGLACAPEDAPPGLVPWFRIKGRASADVPIVFGHWSALGLIQETHLLGLDTGCVWGRNLTAARIDADGVGGLWCVDCAGLGAAGIG